MENSVSRVGLLRKPVECKNLKVKGPLGQLSRAYPREVNVEREESGYLKVSEAVDTRKSKPDA